jgi:ADP-heptose:LPS heptosyltransferase
MINRLNGRDILPDYSIPVRNVRKIAVLRANALGDFVVTLPALAALKETYPDAELILFGKPWHKEFLLKGRTVVDRVIVVPPIKGIRDEKSGEADEKELTDFFESVKVEKIDLAIHFQGKGIAAARFLNRLGAGLTAGMVCAESERLDRSIPYFYYQNEVAKYLEVASLAGAKPVTLDPVVNILQTDLEEVSIFRNKFLSRKYVVIHTCSTDIRRMWQEEKFVSVAQALINTGYDIVFTGTSEDLGYADKIVRRVPGAVNSCGLLSLGGLAALFSQSELVISVDTGPLHLAKAVKAKTIGLYWAPNAINWTYLTRADHIPVISWKMNCPICNVIPNDPFPFEPHTSDCNHNVSFISDISAEEVVTRAEELLKN